MGRSKLQQDLVFRLRADVKELKRGLKDAKGKTKDFATNAKRSTKEVGQAFGNLGVSILAPFTQAIGAAKNGIIGMARAVYQSVIPAFGAMGAAFVATGIGAVITAIVVGMGAIYAWVTKTVGGAQKWAKIMAWIGGIFDGIMDRAAAIGQFIAEGGLWGNDKAMANLKENFAQMKGIAEIAENLVQLQEDENKLWERKQKAALKIVNLENEIAVARAKSMDLQRSDAAEALKANLSAIAKTKELVSIKKGLADEELRIAEERGKQAKNDIATEEELTRLRVEAAQLQAQQANGLKKLFSMRNTLIVQIDAAQAKEIKGYQSIQDEIKKANDLKAEGLTLTSGTEVQNNADEQIQSLVNLLEEKKRISTEAEQLITDDLTAQTEARAGILGNVFKGMSDIITNSLNSTQNIFQAFGKFFGDFVKGMIIKLVSMTLAALALVAVMSLIPGLGATMGLDGAIGKVGKFKAALGVVSGKGFANGGLTDGGLTMVGERGKEIVNLPKGSRVSSAADTKQMMNGGNSAIIPDVRLRGEDIWLSFQEYERKTGNSR